MIHTKPLVSSDVAAGCVWWGTRFWGTLQGESAVYDVSIYCEWHCDLCSASRSDLVEELSVKMQLSTK